MNAINLVGGAPAALTVNGSSVVGPAGACSDIDTSSSSSGSGGGSGGGGDGWGGFGQGSILPRCERPVSSLVCVHPKPPPLIAGADVSSSSSSSSSGGGGSGSGGSSSSNSTEGGGGVSSSTDYSGEGRGDDDEAGAGVAEMRLQWKEELCASNGTEKVGLWEYLDGVEESALRYKVSGGIVSGEGGAGRGDWGSGGS